MSLRAIEVHSGQDAATQGYNTLKLRRITLDAERERPAMRGNTMTDTNLTDNPEATNTAWIRVEKDEQMDGLSDALWGGSKEIRRTLEAIIELYLSEAEDQLGETLVYLQTDAAREQVEYILDEIWVIAVAGIGEGIRRGINHWIETGRGVPEGIAA